MKKSNIALGVSKQMAASMASGWSDEYLLTKKPEDLVRAYGCSFEAAERVLNNELTRRKLRR